MSNPVAAYLGQMLAYGGGAALVAYALFQFLGKSWLENWFKERLEQYKHQQALELQRLRVEIDSLLSGAIKLQEREFDVLPQAWQKLDQAHGLVTWLVHPMQSYPDLDRMDTQELSEFLESSELPISQRNRISTAQRKTTAYIEIIFWHRLSKVRTAVGDLRDFTAANGIFLTPELKVNFTKVVELLWSAITAKSVGIEAKDYKLQGQGWERVQNEVEPLYKAIETTIQARLQSHGSRPTGP